MDPPALDRFVAPLAALLFAGAAAASDPAARAAITAFRASLLRLPPQGRADAEAESFALPVCRHWERAVAAAGTSHSADLIAALRALGPALAWAQNPNYRRQPPDPGFLDAYGYAVIAGPASGPPALAVASDLALGILLLGPGCLYPAHAHPAVELYVPLGSDGLWWTGAAPGWRNHPPGSVIYHAPGVPHAMRAESQPLLAVYLWRGDLATHARLLPPSQAGSPGAI